MNFLPRAIALFFSLGLISLIPAAHSAAEFWTPAHGPLKTRWAKDVSAIDPLPEYPRPQLVRKDWLNLNGLWDFAITGREATRPEKFEQQILVPFPVESALSGVMKTVTEKDRLWYHRTFEIPRGWSGQRVLLHFGAVDFETTVWINGHQVGTHRGGYDAFSFEISHALKESGANELLVAVWDPTDAGPYARGKQVRRPDRGIFYTATSGIWQTVWIEPVPAQYIETIALVPDIDLSKLKLIVQANVVNPAFTVEASAFDGARRVSIARGPLREEIALWIPNAKLWSPAQPFLYNLKVTLKHAGKSVDLVQSYFGMRKVALGKDAKGITRIFLNNQPFFMLGPLDQGFWPDGLYTAPTDEALRYDIEITKKLGFNMARKHVKVEPARWYYWCDQLGLLVWQDMPSGDKFIGANDPDIQRTPESAEQFERELKAMIDTHFNHPSIVMWVIFNEGWGQYDVPRLTDWVKRYDPTRLANNASGWADRRVGDVHDMHKYPGPGSPQPEPTRAAVLGEFGGLGFRVDGHTWAGSTWGYRGMESIEKLTQQYIKLMRGVYALKESPGLSAAVYTQTTDVEFEGNGLLTYDREVVKMNIATVAAANRGQFPPAPKVTVLAPTAQTQALLWRFTTNRPPENWFEPAFDASSWAEGAAGFGSRGTPGAIIGTEWRTADIWIRRTFELNGAALEEVRLLMHHDEDAEVYLNGVLAARTSRWTSDYDEFEITPEARRTLKTGRNVIAIHCRQTGGGQYIDAGLIHLTPP
ncbi:MAG: sugar-binding domain-containing protein [Verrucomicrobiota bacterium]